MYSSTYTLTHTMKKRTRIKCNLNPNANSMYVTFNTHTHTHVKSIEYIWRGARKIDIVFNTFARSMNSQFILFSVLCRYDETIYNIMCNNRAAFYSNGKQLQLKSPFELSKQASQLWSMCCISSIYRLYGLFVLAFYHDSRLQCCISKMLTIKFPCPIFSCVLMHCQCRKCALHTNNTGGLSK